MASISGIKPGLVPTETEEFKRRRVQKEKKPPKPDPVYFCAACEGRLETKRRRVMAFTNHGDDDANYCLPCTTHFGLAMGGGATNDSPQGAKEKIERLRKEGWAMILRAGSFSSAGATVSVEPGDIMKPARIGLVDNSDEDDRPYCTPRRTQEMFSITIKIGPHELTLFTHEFGSISFVAVMEMRKAGELVDAFVSDDDEVGHFTPTPKIREMIYNAFGRSVNAPRR